MKEPVGVGGGGGEGSDCKGSEVEMHLTYLRKSEDSSPDWKIPVRG